MKGKWIRRILLFVCAGVFVYSAISLVLVWHDYAESDAIYEESLQFFHTDLPIGEEDEGPAADTSSRSTAQRSDTSSTDPASSETSAPASAGQEPASTQPASTEPQREFTPASVDFAALKKVNPEAVGWLWIEGTRICYPIMQGSDNEKYLTTAYNGKKSKAGSIFLDYRSNADFADQNTIVYGHNRLNSAMFGTLPRYDQSDYFKKHNTVLVITPEKTLKYTIFSAYPTPDDGNAYTLRFPDDAAFAAYTERAAASSDVKSGSLPKRGEKLLTLSTCTSDGNKSMRFVVHAFLTEESKPQA